jgi:hypothetical protein
VRTVFGAHLVLAVALLTFDAAAVSAQEDGVFIDPDSPAGTEYAIPLEQARREAAGGGPTTREAAGGGPTTQGRAGNEQPLFGAGIAPRSEAKGESAIGDARGGGARKPRAAGVDKAPRPGSNAGASTAAIAAAAGDGSSEGLLTAGIAAAVLALGLAAGLAFRRALKGP